jgi:Ca-activated chloride channel family protein
MKRLSPAREQDVAKRIATSVLLLIAVVAYAGEQAVPAGRDRDPESFRIKVDVPLVVLHATVTDREGALVCDLDERDFHVYEDRIPQDIRLFLNEDVPVTVGVVVDHSTTMLSKLAEVTAASRTFVQSSNREDEMFVVNFNERVSLGLPSTVRFTNSTAELENAIAHAPAKGETALYDAIAIGLQELQAGSRDKKVLIVVSDGGDNASVHDLSQVMQLAGRSSAVIYTIGIFDDEDPDRNPGVLKHLARATGGEAFFPTQMSEVVTICGRIARDIRHQYTIGYAPSNPARDGAYRAIRVLAGPNRHDKLTVRTRAGYIAGGEPRHSGKDSQ